MVKPDIKKIMEVRAECFDEKKDVGTAIATMVNYCYKMFTNDYYREFSLDFAKIVLTKFL